MNTKTDVQIVHVARTVTADGRHGVSMCGIPLRIDAKLTDANVSAPDSNVIVCACCEAATALEDISELEKLK